MKITYEKIFVSHNYSIITRKLKLAAYPGKVHSHSNFELIFIVNGSGKRIVGHNISDFSNGDLVLLPPNLPHSWYTLEFERNDESETYVTHFNEKINTSDSFRIPELEQVVNLLKCASGGIWFKGAESEKVGNILQKMTKVNGLERYIELLKVFRLLIQIEDRVNLSLPSSLSNSFIAGNELINKVYDYVFKNIQTGVSLNEAAALMYKEPASFCRYFKNKTNQTFMSYVKNVRIGMASKMLAETNKPITQICYECGYNNLANFNHYFKVIINKTPSHYRKDFR